jgi:Ca2+:H+ antiporter
MEQQRYEEKHPDGQGNDHAVSNLFMGAVVIDIIGNVAEHAGALMMAGRDRTEAVFSITVGSSVQIALLVAPILVFVSWAIQPSMSLLFSPLEIAGVGIAVVAVAMIAWDGETSWLEGAQLLAVYLVFAPAIYWMPMNSLR